jgi:large subunit ribosomal protein L9
MKVLLRKNVASVGKIGDLVDVKSGYARNYLLPQGLAYQPTAANIRQVELEREKYLAELARQRAEIAARAALVDGKEVTITARANEEGHLYGSIGPAQIVAALAEQNCFVDADNIVMPEPIRTLDKYDITLTFGEDVTAAISVWVVPIHGEAGEGETEAAPETAPDDAPETAEDPE